ncbi:MAG: SDR family NAD(P)-dependent oxidoreductase [Chloroflexota bacterium]
MDLGLKGKTALITGAAGGIGGASAQLLAEEGARVAVADLRAPDCAADASVPMDVTSDRSVLEAVAEVEWRLGPIDVLVNCAGIYRIGQIGDVDPAAWDQLMNVNLRGTYLVCHAVLPGMLQRGAGSIVNLSSISGRTKSILAAPSYVASKAGVIGLTMALASQSAARGVRVNAIAPGPVDTEMIRGLPEALKPGLLSTIPLGRLGTTLGIAQAIAFLASDAAGHITGETLNVNGGAFMV